MSKIIKIYCDKCKKEIIGYEPNHVMLARTYSFDFCTDCFNSVLRTVGSCIKGDDEVVEILTKTQSEMEKCKRNLESLHYDDLENSENYNNGIQICIDIIQEEINSIIGK